MNFMASHKYTRFALGFVAAYLCLSVCAVPVGPKLPNEERKPVSSSIGPTYDPLDIPALDFAVVVFDPQLDANDDRMREKGGVA